MKKTGGISTGDELKEVLGSDLYKKIIYSILRVQSEITRSFDIPSGGEFISFDGPSLIWSLTGKNISNKDISKFQSKDDNNKIRMYAIKSLKRGQKLTGSELQKIELSLEGKTGIKILPKNYNALVPIKEGWLKKIINSAKSIWNSFINFLF
jgi:hypothetical protein